VTLDQRMTRIEEIGWLRADVCGSSLLIAPLFGKPAQCLQICIGQVDPGAFELVLNSRDNIAPVLALGRVARCVGEWSVLT
jgi:hypothetical protein